MQYHLNMSPLVIVPCMRMEAQWCYSRNPPSLSRREEGQKKARNSTNVLTKVVRSSTVRVPTSRHTYARTPERNPTSVTGRGASGDSHGQTS